MLNGGNLLISLVGRRLDKIRSQIEAGALNSALAAIQDTVDRVFCEPSAVAKVFGAPELDRLCQAIGRVNLNRLGLGQRNQETRNADGPVAYLASRLQASGGHTAALVDIIRLSGDRQSVVIVSGTCGRTDTHALRNRFSDLPMVSLELAPRGSHLSKLDWIQRRLLEIRPRTVWLFNHHQDSVAIAAVQPNEGYRVCFYHHADHHLCLGLHLSYAEHYDPHPMGFHNCRNSLGISNNRYLPLVVSDQGDRPPGLAFLESGHLVTCTAASSNKVEVPYFVRYVDMVPEILSITRGRHIHIGRLTPLARRRISKGLRHHNVPKESFVYIPYVPSVWRALHEYRVDLYLASFPYGGGRTLLEAMGAGIPVVVHKHCRSRMLGGFDMAYDGAFTWQTREELQRILASLDRDTLARHSRWARAQYEKHHRDEILVTALTDHNRLEAPQLSRDYQPKRMSQALERADPATLRRFVYCVLCYAYRRWQAWQGRWI
ncbi:hypothetical protein [Pelomicrobium sp. G1]|uniref:glycosyltransferase n=1 Tax=Pelomicrobium sp. G1 TaxID=3452920 RepID=UPI000AB63DD4